MIRQSLILSGIEADEKPKINYIRPGENTVSIAPAWAALALFLQQDLPTRQEEMYLFVQLICLRLGFILRYSFKITCICMCMCVGMCMCEYRYPAESRRRHLIPCSCSYGWLVTSHPHQILETKLRSSARSEDTLLTAESSPLVLCFLIFLVFGKASR